MARASYPSLMDRHVFVTGGGSGIGEAIVEAFVGQGSRVTFVDIAEESAQALTTRLARGAQHPPTFARCDLTDVTALQRTIAEAQTRAGDIAVLVNNAGNDDRHSPTDVTPDYWDNRLAVNLRHLFFAAQAVVPGMTRRGGGAILNLGSISWHIGLPDLVLYQTAKAGIEGMSRALARDLGGDNIRVNTIVPGAVRTPRQDALWLDDAAVAALLDSQCLKARVTPADVAALALFLASDDARMCTGHAYFVDAGWR